MLKSVPQFVTHQGGVRELGTLTEHVVARIASFVPEETFRHKVGDLFSFFGHITHLRKKALINDYSALR
jgi:hypothetical protein